MTAGGALAGSYLEASLSRAREEGRKLFIPYLTAGLPSPQGFVELAAELSGLCDAIEVGIPFSDPLMDGPIIQEASKRALEAGINVDRCFDLVREAKRHLSIPVAVMTYVNPVLRRGIPAFVKGLGDAGASGLIVPDLPYEESGELRGALASRGIASVQMVAPSTPPDRVGALVRASGGFVYAVARMGVTGERDSLEDSARWVVERIRPHTTLPVLLGIGISNAASARAGASIADGVIVGSALMKKVLSGDTRSALGLAREVRTALGG